MKIRSESVGGIIMIICAALALIMVNSPLSGIYTSIITDNVKYWVNDLLMVFFFLVIALELKREMCEGFLSKRDQILLPFFAAIGGMAAPALIFLGINSGNPENFRGWAIPSATDIAFAIAVLSLLAKNVPAAARIFLLAIAIFDDLGAIIIIALFYNSGLALMPFLLSCLGIGMLVMLNRCHINRIAPYIAAGVIIWFGFHHSGIHTTLAGVLVGLSIPMRDAKQNSPVNAAIHFFHPWVTFGVLPIFAFANSAINLRGLDPICFLLPLPLGIALGLFIGKQVGIFGVSYLLIKSKIASMPLQTSWLNLYAISIIAGIGFTMSLFIGNLAFSEPLLLKEVKIGVLGGLILCIVWGSIIIKIADRKRI